MARLKLRLAVETVRILDLEAVTGGFLLAGNRRLGDAVNNYSKGGSCQGLCMSNGQGKDCASMLGNCEGG